MTYSIIARDPKTGRFGMAVATRWFGVGRIVGFTQCGVGVVATQSFVHPGYGPDGLRLMKTGKTASATLKQLLAADPMGATRQVAMIDAKGRSAAHTGKGCVRYANHVKATNVSAQANMMLSDGVPEAMIDAYCSSEGDFGDKLVAALVAAEAIGGDIRGRQSAAMFVSGPDGAPSWQKEIDIRVDDHRKPLVELKRLLGVSRAYDLLGAFEDGSKRPSKAARQALKFAPGDDQIAFYVSQTGGQAPWATTLFKQVLKKNKNWSEYSDRIEQARKSWPKQ